LASQPDANRAPTVYSLPDRRIHYSPTVLFDLIRTLIDTIILTPQDEELTLSIKGELAGILNLCSDRKKPGLSDRASAEQIKMVAGARMHLYRTRSCR
jgi:hypothetical protein